MTIKRLYGTKEIIWDGYGYGITDGWTVNRFFITEDGKALFDYQPNKTELKAVYALIKKGVLFCRYK